MKMKNEFNFVAARQIITGNILLFVRNHRLNSIWIVYLCRRFLVASRDIVPICSACRFDCALDTPLISMANTTMEQLNHFSVRFECHRKTKTKRHVARAHIIVRRACGQYTAILQYSTKFVNMKCIRMTKSEY